MKRKLLAAILLVPSCYLFAQKKTVDLKDKRTVFISSTMGGNIALSKSSLQSPYPALVGTGQRDFYFQIFSASYFGKHYWGASADVGIRSGDSKDAAFFKQVNGMYGNNYFVSTATDRYYENGVNMHALAGPAYKAASGRIMMIYQLLFGINNYKLQNGYVQLKERNANTLIDISYQRNQKSTVSFAISPSINVAYRLNKRLYANLNVKYMWWQAKASYIQNNYNYQTQEQTYANYSSKENVQSLSIGAGVMLLISSIKTKYKR